MTRTEPAAKANMRIGLFGGSFNPAHKGHLHISKTALERLALDRVWWLLSPQNPLKNAADYASYEERARSARAVIDDPRIILSSFEREHGFLYSVETIRHLLRLHPRVKFVWLMGADAFAGLDRWKDWQEIMENIPVAVFDRPEYGERAQASTAAQRYGSFRLAQDAAPVLADKKAPAWCFIHQPLDNTSSTQIRAGK